MVLYYCVHLYLQGDMTVDKISYTYMFLVFSGQEVLAYVRQGYIHFLRKKKVIAEYRSGDMYCKWNIDRCFLIS